MTRVPRQPPAVCVPGGVRADVSGFSRGPFWCREVHCHGPQRQHRRPPERLGGPGGGPRPWEGLGGGSTGSPPSESGLCERGKPCSRSVLMRNDTVRSPFPPTHLWLCFTFLFSRQANRPPAKLNLLTCQVKTNPEERKCFDLISRKLISQAPRPEEPFRTVCQGVGPFVPVEELIWRREACISGDGRTVPQECPA